MSKGEVKQVNGKRVATPEYRSWQAMKNRVTNPSAHDWRYYGGRGICMAIRWLEFDAFLADMGRRPTSKHTLERIDNDGNYWKGNCIWATRQEQARNRDYCKLMLEKARQIRELYQTGGYSQTELAKLFGVSQLTISHVTRHKTWREEGGGS